MPQMLLHCPSGVANSSWELTHASVHRCEHHVGEDGDENLCLWFHPSGTDLNVGFLLLR